MIVKSLSRKRPTFKSLLTYVLRESSQGNKAQVQRSVIRQNLTGRTIEQWVKEFEKNETNRIHQRANNVKIFHEILSFHRNEKHITIEKLQDIGKAYLQLRNENAVALGAIHEDREHLHLHFCISGVEAKTGKALRISKAEFQLVKQRIQEYQKSKYPEFSKSIVDHTGQEKKKQKDREYQLTKRTKEPSEKERTKAILEQCYWQSLSRADFIKRVTESGLKVYERGGKLAGIEGDRKMRFSTLGFGEAKMQELDDRASNLLEIGKMREVEAEREIEKTYEVFEYSNSDGKENDEPEGRDVDFNKDELDINGI